MNIPLNTVLVAFLLLASGCEQKKDGHDHDANGDVENSGNQALYDEVMSIHDEVMPKMNDLYQTKTSLQTRLELPGLSESERQEITGKIARLDSAGEGMMEWMRQFEPLPDSVGEDEARAYLESELTKVNKVREDILEALKTAGSED